ncbi:MAG: hypothetical protein IIB00_01540 [candidate division Zixibacteria bacterium]|nr:hypothetical protein [candidate division Zixibacteria bacterium]
MRNKLIGALSVALICVTLLTVNSSASIQGRQIFPKADSYESLFNSFVNMKPDPEMVAEVTQFTLKQDVATFTFEKGRIYMLTPILGRRCAAVFVGEGVFDYAPPTWIEREQLMRFYDTDSLHEEFTFLFMVFSDSVLKELTNSLEFSSGKFPRKWKKTFENCHKYISNNKTKYLHYGIAKTFLEGEDNELFYSHFSFRKLNPMFFEIDPYQNEEVRFRRRDILDPEYYAEVINQFHRSEDYESGIDSLIETQDIIAISNYVIDARIDRSLDFEASAEIEFSTVVDNHQWFDFYLYKLLKIDSVLWDDGERVDYFRGKQAAKFWIKSRQPLADGENIKIKIYYHGKILKRVMYWITIRSASYWYPRHQSSRTKATFDLTFHTPKRYTFVTVGEKVAEDTVKGEITSRWIIRDPVRWISFNLGAFKNYEIEDERIPPVTVLISEAGHKELEHYLGSIGNVSGRDVEKNVGADVANSLAFFSQMFGACSAKQIYATEIFGDHGEAFPGLIHLAWSTYQRTSKYGYDAIFRAHEVAHQWWGIGVEFETYHDQWLSEGFSSYSGLWYLQFTKGDNARFFSMLLEWKNEVIKNQRNLEGKGRPAGPISLGYRAGTHQTPGSYEIIVYKKGAWVLHMLRNLLIDLNTMNEDKFISVMRDFYQNFKGKRATTRDFQKIIEQYTESDMSWFFNQWVNSVEIPTYYFSYKVDKKSDSSFVVSCRIKQENTPADFVMPVPILIRMGENGIFRFRSFVRGAITEFELPALPYEPTEVIFNDLESVLCEVKNVSW